MPNPLPPQSPQGLQAGRCRTDAGPRQGRWHRRRRPPPHGGEAAAPRAGGTPSIPRPQNRLGLPATRGTAWMPYSREDDPGGRSENPTHVVVPAGGVSRPLGGRGCRWRRLRVSASLRLPTSRSGHRVGGLAALAPLRFASSSVLAPGWGGGWKRSGAEWAALRAHAPLVSSDSTHARCCPMRFIDAVASAGLQRKVVGSQ